MSSPSIGGISFSQNAFRLEDESGPEPDELDAFRRFMNGRPLLPSQWPLWQEWLDQMQDTTLQCTVTSVILLYPQPTDYQRWRIWAAPWHLRAGQRMLFLPILRAHALGIPVGNWWLFDDATLSIGGEVITGPLVDQYRRGRDLAIEHAADIAELETAAVLHGTGRDVQWVSPAVSGGGCGLSAGLPG